MPSSSILPKPGTNAVATNHTSNASIPPPLPPSVEAAYRRKCIQLKRRMNEVDETNDAYRVRRVRLNRGILKLRLERAFLLDQLAKRTEDPAEDTEGSPSPPPTPKEGAPRLKRNGAPSENQKNSPLLTSYDPSARMAPSSERAGPGGDIRPRNKHLPGSSPPLLAIASNKRSSSRPGASNDRHESNGQHTSKSTSTRTPSAYLLFCSDKREDLKREHADDAEFNLTKTLAQTWRSLGRDGQKPWADEFLKLKEASIEANKKAVAEPAETEKGRAKKSRSRRDPDPEDVEDKSADEIRGEDGMDEDAGEDTTMMGIDEPDQAQRRRRQSLEGQQQRQQAAQDQDRSGEEHDSERERELQAQRDWEAFRDHELEHISLKIQSRNKVSRKRTNTFTGYVNVRRNGEFLGRVSDTMAGTIIYRAAGPNEKPEPELERRSKQMS